MTDSIAFLADPVLHPAKNVSVTVRAAEYIPELQPEPDPRPECLAQYEYIEPPDGLWLCSEIRRDGSREEQYPDHWDDLNLFPEWYFNHGWHDVASPGATIDALLKAADEMCEKEPDQWKKHKLMMVRDGIRILEDMHKRKQFL